MVLERDDTFLLRQIDLYIPEQADSDLDSLEEATQYYGMVGFAANQLGINNRVCVAKDGEKFIRLHDPHIVAQSTRKVFEREGCFSLPGYWAIVPRSATIIVKHLINGVYKSSGYRGRVARVIQHEIDHLNGILISDYVARKVARKI